MITLIEIKKVMEISLVLKIKTNILITFIKTNKWILN